MNWTCTGENTQRCHTEPSEWAPTSTFFLSWAYAHTTGHRCDNKRTTCDVIKKTSFSYHRLSFDFPSYFAVRLTLPLSMDSSLSQINISPLQVVCPDPTSPVSTHTWARPPVFDSHWESSQRRRRRCVSRRRPKAHRPDIHFVLVTTTLVPLVIISYIHCMQLH